MAIPDEKCINGDRAGEVRHTITEIQGVDEEQNKLLLQERAARIEAEAAYQRLYDLFMQAPASHLFSTRPAACLRACQSCLLTDDRSPEPYRKTNSRSIAGIGGPGDI